MRITFQLLVSDKTGITTGMLRHERPLSVVLPEFLRWVEVTIGEVTEGTDVRHFPGKSNTIVGT